jgi:hypothetical protein
VACTAHVGTRRRRTLGCIPARFLVAPDIDGLRARSRGDCVGLHRLRSCGWAPRRTHRREQCRHDLRCRRRGGGDRVAVAACPRPRRTWSKGPVATPKSVRRKHAVVASVLPRRRLGGCGGHRRRNHRGRALPPLATRKRSPEVTNNGSHSPRLCRRRNRPCDAGNTVATFRQARRIGQAGVPAREAPPSAALSAVLAVAAGTAI